MNSSPQPNEPEKSTEKPLEGSIVPGSSANHDVGLFKANLEGIKSYLNLMTDTERAAAGQLLVVMDKHRTTVVEQPGLSKPFSTKNRRYAEMVAKEKGGVVEPLLTALKLVATSPCNFPPDSKFYDPDPAARKLPTI